MLNINIINSIAPYIEILYNVNKLLIKLWGINYYNCHDGSDILLQIIHDVPRLVPYSFDKKIQILKLNNNNGLLNFKNDIEYLFENYQQILDDNYYLLDKIRVLRNKDEHQLHILKEPFNIGDENNGSFKYFYEIKDETIIIESNEITSLLKELNFLFFKLVLEIKSYAESNNKEKYSFYEKISRFNFFDFNTIYDSYLLHKIGIIQFDF